MQTEEQIIKNIRQAYLVKFGNLYISNKDMKIPEAEHCYSVRPWWKILKKDEQPPLEIKKLVDCFEKSPQVEKVTLNGKKQEIQWLRLSFDPHMRNHFKPVLTLELNIPLKNQQYAKSEKEILGDKMESINKFTVFYDGSNYIITAKVQDITKHHFVIDVRDLLFNLLEEDFRVEEIPPNPMRENYYLLFLSDISKVGESEIIVEKGPPNEFLILEREEEIKRKNEIVSRMLIRSVHFLDIFYAGSMIAQNLRKKYVELNKLHIRIQKKDKEFFTTPSHSLFKRRKTKKDIEDLIQKHYEIILDSNICLNLIQDAEVIVKEQSANLLPFSNTVDKLMGDNFQYYPLKPDLYSVCLEHTKEMMERSFSWRLALYAIVFSTITSLLVNYGEDIINFLKSLSA